MASRKDNKGRVLRTGESQRSNGGYEFRYFDAKKKRHSIYAATLNELREKEKHIQSAYAQGTNYAEGNMTVVELVEKYLSTKSGLSYNTKCCYKYVFDKISSSQLAHKSIRDVKISDAKKWMNLLAEKGLGYWSINQIKGVISPAFELAVEDEILLRNPFSFSLSKVVPATPRQKDALTYGQQKNLLKAFSEHPTYYPRYELIAIMLGTGMRVGEITGLTFDDIDMKRRTISINHQLQYNFRRGLYISSPKTDSGHRIIPMSDTVYNCFKTVLKQRRFVADEPTVNGLSGFVFLTKRGTPDYSSLIQTAISGVVRDFNKNASDPLPHISPHILRHTFCTNMIESGVSIKQVQYLMGHSKANVTMNVYAHVMKEKSNDGIVEAMNQICSQFI